jgi:DeoR family transcriptional regulator, ulaG and ulaABCDEF operon transcriptional repressor
MHATEREGLILRLLRSRGFVSFQDLESQVDASPATLRRDLERMAQEGHLQRVRGGAQLSDKGPARASSVPRLAGAPFHENISVNTPQKRLIGKKAAGLCKPGEAVMIDGGSTTLQMCSHLEGLNLQVLTNSLHIVSALLPQTSTRILLPAGTVFREQNIILSAAGEESMPRFHAPKLFMGAAAVGPQGIMQADVVLVAAERRLMDRADEVILLVDSSKFRGPSGHVVCGLEIVDTIVTDGNITTADRKMVEKAGVKLIVAN